MADELAAQREEEWAVICGSGAALRPPIPTIRPTAILSGDNRGV